LPASSFQ